MWFFLSVNNTSLIEIQKEDGAVQLQCIYPKAAPSFPTALSSSVVLNQQITNKSTYIYTHMEQQHLTNAILSGLKFEWEMRAPPILEDIASRFLQLIKL